MGYLFILLGFIGALGLAYSSGHKAGDTSRVKLDQPRIERLEGDKATAEAANAGLQRDVTRLKTTVEENNKRLTDMAQQGLDAQADQTKAVDNFNRRMAALGPTLERRILEAKAPPSNRTDAEKCTAAKATLGDLSDAMLGAIADPTTPAAKPVQPVAAPKHAPPKPKPAPRNLDEEVRKLKGEIK
jgi:hypothetical protein